MRLTKIAAMAVLALGLLSGCAASKMQFHPIEGRSIPQIVRLKMINNTDPRLQDGMQDGSISSTAINFDVFRAKVMQSTNMRFVEANEDAKIYISQGELVQKQRLWGLFGSYFEMQCSMRIVEPKSGRIIYIVTGTLVGPHGIALGDEMNRLFVQQVIPVLEGNVNAPVAMR